MPHRVDPTVGSLRPLMNWNGKWRRLNHCKSRFEQRSLILYILPKKKEGTKAIFISFFLQAHTHTVTHTYSVKKCQRSGNGPFSKLIKRKLQRSKEREKTTRTAHSHSQSSSNVQTCVLFDLAIAGSGRSGPSLPTFSTFLRVSGKSVYKKRLIVNVEKWKNLLLGRLYWLNFLQSITSEE